MESTGNVFNNKLLDEFYTQEVRVSCSVARKIRNMDPSWANMLISTLAAYDPLNRILRTHGILNSPDGTPHWTLIYFSVRGDGPLPECSPSCAINRVPPGPFISPITDSPGLDGKHIIFRIGEFGNKQVSRPQLLFFSNVEEFCTEI